MPRFTPTPVTADAYSTATLNANFSEIASNLARALYRDGDAPNEMTALLDMNSNDINNVATLRATNLFVNGQDLQALYDTVAQAVLDAQTAETGAQAAETGALAAQTAAEQARDFASQWSSNPPDTLVNDGINPANYSAYHWALISQAASAALVYKGLWDASTGVYPAGPYQSGDLWIVSVAGTVDLVNWQIGDWLIRNVANDGWDRVARVVDWATIVNVPANVENAVNSTAPVMTGNPIINTSNPNVTLIATGTSIDGSKWDIILLNADKSLRFRVWDAAQTAILRQYLFSAGGNTQLPGLIQAAGDVISSQGGFTSRLTGNNLEFDRAGISYILNTAVDPESSLRLGVNGRTNDVRIDNDGGFLLLQKPNPTSEFGAVSKQFLEANYPSNKVWEYGQWLATTSQTTTQWLRICEINLTGAYDHKQLTFDLVGRFQNQRVTVEAEVNATNDGYSYVRVTSLGNSSTPVAIVAWVNTFGQIFVAAQINAYSGNVGARVVADVASSSGGAVTWTQDTWTTGKPSGSILTVDGFPVRLVNDGNVRLSAGIKPNVSQDLTPRDFVAFARGTMSVAGAFTGYGLTTVRNGLGQFTATFDTAQPDTNYQVQLTSQYAGSPPRIPAVYQKLTTGFTIRTVLSSTGAAADAATDITVTRN